MTTPTGILLFAHGARDPAWARPFEATAQRLREAHAQAEVALAFLEFMSPGIVDAGEALVAKGCQQITVVPLFLGAGGHVRKDLPELMKALAARHPTVDWRLSLAVGETDILVTALADAAWALSQATASNVAPGA
jgi:sirohydrochlorin cobaltochelatase